MTEMLLRDGIDLVLIEGAANGHASATIRDGALTRMPYSRTHIVLRARLPIASMK